MRKRRCHSSRDVLTIKNTSKKYAAHKAQYCRLNSHISNLLTDSELNLVIKKIEENRPSTRPGQIDLTSDSKIQRIVKNIAEVLVQALNI